jgi:gamma-glutamylcyclotransferase (GGCT)/AIG2-like uncharacterized protein YtfP
MTNLNFFFYGTLMTREGRDSYMAGLAEPVGVAQLEDAELYNVGAFPAYLPGEGTITGELWRALGEDTLPALTHLLDRIEGYDEGNPAQSMYHRVTVTLADGTVAQTYRWNGRKDYLRRIPGDDWKRYLGWERFAPR